MQSLIDTGFVRKRIMVRNQLGANNLEGQCYCRHQHQQCGDRCSVSVSSGAEQPGYRDIVGEVHRAHQSGTSKQRHAAAYNLAAQTFQRYAWRHVGAGFKRRASCNNLHDVLECESSEYRRSKPGELYYREDSGSALTSKVIKSLLLHSKREPDWISNRNISATVIELPIHRPYI